MFDKIDNKIYMEQNFLRWKRFWWLVIAIDYFGVIEKILILMFLKIIFFKKKYVDYVDCYLINGNGELRPQMVHQALAGAKSLKTPLPIDTCGSRRTYLSAAKAIGGLFND